MPELSDAAQFWIAALAGLASIFAVVWSVRTGVRQGKSDEAYRQGMEAVQRQQAEAQERIAAAVAETVTSRSSAPDKPPPAMLSMDLIRHGRGYRLLIQNRGSGPAKVLDVKSLSDPSLLVGPLGLEDLTLLRGESHSIHAAPTLATSPHPKLWVSWLDAEGSTKSREQTLSL